MCLAHSASSANGPALSNLLTETKPVLPIRQRQGRGEAKLFPGIHFAAQGFVAVLHAVFDDGPDIRVAALPFADGSVTEIGQVEIAQKDDGPI